MVIALFCIITFFIGLLLTKSFKINNVENSATQKEEPPITIDIKKLKELTITDREYEVLIELADGKSNDEISKKLFVSESTVKTHVSNLLAKLNAKRRTEAVKKAKELRILKH